MENAKSLPMVASYGLFVICASTLSAELPEKLSREITPRQRSIIPTRPSPDLHTFAIFATVGSMILLEVGQDSTTQPEQANMLLVSQRYHTNDLDRQSR